MPESRRNFLRSAAAALATGATALHATDQHPTAQEAGAMDGVAETFLQSHGIAGMSIGIAIDGELVHEKGYGLANTETREKMTPAHLFRIASVSKPITSVAIFQLIEEGKLQMDDSVFGPQSIFGSDFGAPPYKPHVANVRLKHLLTHTAGGWQNDNTDPMFRNPSMNHHELITWALANVRLQNPPGEHYAYSNFGYCIVGRAIEKLTGLPYDQYVRTKVLQRCGIEDMRIGGNRLADRAPNEVVYYGDRNQDPYSMNVRRMDSHGGWLATATDLVRFAAHVDGLSPRRNILRPQSIARMTTATAANPQYACGWAVNHRPNWWHAGSLPGTASIMVRTAGNFCWAALLNGREATGDTSGALDNMMWQIVAQVRSWRP